MNCRIVEENLDSFLRGRLQDDARAEMERHLRLCRSCRNLGSLWAAGEIQPDRPNDFIRAVLARTSGGACARARALLCDFADGELNAVDASLVGAHLEGCPGCSQLARALEEMRADLRTLAEVDPGRDFAAEVVRRTSTVIQASRRHPDPWAEKFRRWGAALVGRPRFAWEAAYVGTLLIVLAFGNPLSSSYGSFRDVRFKQPAPLRELSREVPDAWNKIRVKSTGAAHSAAAQVSESISDAAKTVSESLRQTWQRIEKGRLWAR